jgi:hypothetical protein
LLTHVSGPFRSNLDRDSVQEVSNGKFSGHFYDVESLSLLIDDLPFAEPFLGGKASLLSLRKVEPILLTDQMLGAAVRWSHSILERSDDRLRSSLTAVEQLQRGGGEQVFGDSLVNPISGVGQLVDLGLPLRVLDLVRRSLERIALNRAFA